MSLNSILYLSNLETKILFLFCLLSSCVLQSAFSTSLKWMLSSLFFVIKKTIFSYYYTFRHFCGCIFFLPMDKLFDHQYGFASSDFLLLFPLCYHSVYLLMDFQICPFALECVVLWQGFFLVQRIFQLAVTQYLNKRKLFVSGSDILVQTTFLF